jgi:dTDP-4-amino-4,6-dideoxygalactose transaminase
MSQQTIPFFSLHAMQEAVRAEVLAATARVYDAEWYVLGPEVAQFEQAYSAFNQVAHTVGVSNGLEALTLALRAAPAMRCLFHPIPTSLLGWRYRT